MVRTAALTAALVASLAAPAAAIVDQQRIRFAPGASGTIIRGAIDARQRSGGPGEVRDDYMIAARRGQTLTVAIESDREAYCYAFNDYTQPFQLEINGRKGRKSVRLPKSGDYTIAIESPQGELLRYKLTVEID